MRLLFTGDMYFGGDFLNKLPRSHRDWEHPFKEVAPIFAQANLRVGNLESPLHAGPAPPKKRNLLHSPPESISALRYLGFDVLTLGNNHITDHGREGVIATKKTLNENGISCCGAGVNIDEAARPAFARSGSFVMAVLSYVALNEDVDAEIAGPSTEGCVPLGLSRIEKDIAKALKKANHVCVSLHWGYQYHHYPSPDQIALARAIIDLGALVVHGHHPHVLQGFERHNHGLILYSLGNFFMPDFLRTDGKHFEFPKESRETAIALCDVSPSGVESVRTVPMMITPDMRMVPSTGRTKDRSRAKIERLSEPLRLARYDSHWRAHRMNIQRTLERRQLKKSLQNMALRARNAGFRGFGEKLSLQNLKGGARTILRYLRLRLF